MKRAASFASPERPATAEALPVPASSTAFTIADLPMPFAPRISVFRPSFAFTPPLIELSTLSTVGLIKIKTPLGVRSCLQNHCPRPPRHLPSVRGGRQVSSSEKTSGRPLVLEKAPAALPVVRVLHLDSNDARPLPTSIEGEDWLSHGEGLLQDLGSSCADGTLGNEDRLEDGLAGDVGDRGGDLVAPRIPGAGRLEPRVEVVAAHDDLEGLATCEHSQHDGRDAAELVDLEVAAGLRVGDDELGGAMVLWHVTSLKKARGYFTAGFIAPPVRAWMNVSTAERFSRQTGRRIILRLKADPSFRELEGHRGEALISHLRYILHDF